jgi:hypothetical protein
VNRETRAIGVVIVVRASGQRLSATPACAGPGYGWWLGVARAAVSAHRPSGEYEFVGASKMQDRHLTARHAVQIGELDRIPRQVFQDEQAFNVVEPYAQREAQSFVGDVPAVVCWE